MGSTGVELPEEVRAVLKRHEGYLGELFGKYSEGVPEGSRVMREAAYLKMGRAYGMSPGLLPRVEMLQLFRAMKCEPRTPEWNGRRCSGTLGYGEFCACMAACAAVVFVGDDWDGGLAKKVELFIDWLRHQERPLGTGEATPTPGKGRRALRRHFFFAEPPEREPAEAVVFTGSPEPCTETVQRRFELETELRRVFAFACTRGDRLNVGPDAALTRTQCVRLLGDCGCLASRRLREKVDVACAGSRRVGFDALLELLTKLAPDLYPRLDKEQALRHLIRDRLLASTRSSKNTTPEKLCPKTTVSPSEEEDVGAALVHPVSAVVAAGNKEREARIQKKQQQRESSGLSSPRDKYQTDDAWPQPEYRLNGVGDRDTVVNSETDDSNCDVAADAANVGSYAKTTAQHQVVAENAPLSPASTNAPLSPASTTLEQLAEEAFDVDVDDTNTPPAPLQQDAFVDKHTTLPEVSRLVDAISRDLSATSVAGVPLVRIGSRSDPKTPAVREPTPAVQGAADPPLIQLRQSVADQLRRLKDLQETRHCRVLDDDDDVDVDDDVVDAPADRPAPLDSPAPDSARVRDLEALEAALVDQSKRLANLQARLSPNPASAETAADANANAATAPASPADDGPLVVEALGQADDLFAIQPVESPVDRSKWRILTKAKRPPGWVIADPSKKAAAHRDRSAEFWSRQFLENERALGQSRRGGGGGGVTSVPNTPSANLKTQ